jgi:hypothetical protein
VLEECRQVLEELRRAAESVKRIDHKTIYLLLLSRTRLTSSLLSNSCCFPFPLPIVYENGVTPEIHSLRFGIQIYCLGLTNPRRRGRLEGGYKVVIIVGSHRSRH